MEKQVFLQLLDKYLNGTASPAEERLLDECYRRLDEGSKAALSPEEEKALQRMMLERIRSGVHEWEIAGPARSNRIRRIGYAAASIVLLFAAGGYFLWHVNRGQQATVQNKIADIAPGGNKAVLTLSNGAQLILDSAHDGQLTSQGGSKVLKVGNGLLAYKANSRKLKGRPTGPSGRAQSNSIVSYNTLATPRGGQYRLILPDGTKVWLNAASSIRYPVAFTGGERQVEVRGEVYFEVAKEAARPFRVKLKGMEVEVLGTHFNVKAYGEEDAGRVTLLEGAVMVKTVSQRQRLMPGEQARLSGINELKLVKNVDTRGIVAWTKGQLYMGSADVKEIMRQISRWYDVDVVYEGPVPENHFNGMIDRNVNLSDILKVLNDYGIHCTLTGRQVLVVSK